MGIDIMQFTYATNRIEVLPGKMAKGRFHFVSMAIADEEQFCWATEKWEKYSVLFGGKTNNILKKQCVNKPYGNLRELEDFTHNHLWLVINIKNKSLQCVNYLNNHCATLTMQQYFKSLRTVEQNIYAESRNIMHIMMLSTTKNSSS